MANYGGGGGGGGGCDGPMITSIDGHRNQPQHRRDFPEHQPSRSDRGVGGIFRRSRREKSPLSPTPPTPPNNYYRGSGGAGGGNHRNHYPLNHPRRRGMSAAAAAATAGGGRWRLAPAVAFVAGAAFALLGSQMASEFLVLGGRFSGAGAGLHLADAVLADLSAAGLLSLPALDGGDNGDAAAAATSSLRKKTVVKGGRSTASASSSRRTLTAAGAADQASSSSSSSSSSCPATGLDGNDVRTTLVLQTSLNRLYKLVEHCRRWRSNPIVAVVAVEPEEDLQSALDEVDGKYGEGSSDESDDSDDSDNSESSWSWCPQLTIVEYKLDAEQATPGMYPVNELRNAGLDAVVTSHILLADFDFLPSAILEGTIRDALRQRSEWRKQRKRHLERSGGTAAAAVPSEEEEAIVVPAFERLVPCQKTGKKVCKCKTERECEQLLLGDGGGDGAKGAAPPPSSSFIPRTFEDLAACRDEGDCVVFRDYVKESSHSTTGTADWARRRWYDDPVTGEPTTDAGSSTARHSLKTIRCFDSDNYEPYVVLRWCPSSTASLPSSPAGQQTHRNPVAPYYDETFHGYGWNKIQHINHLRLSGYRFLVLPEGFLVHSPHMPSVSRAEFDRKDNGGQSARNRRKKEGTTAATGGGGLRERMNRSFDQFMQDVKARYSNDVSAASVTPICPTAGENKATTATTANTKTATAAAATTTTTATARTTPVRTTPVRTTPVRTTPVRTTPVRTTPARITPATTTKKKRKRFLSWSSTTRNTKRQGSIILQN